MIIHGDARRTSESFFPLFYLCPDRGLGEDALPYPPAHATGVPGA
jgi:hypothetical protein